MDLRVLGEAPHKVPAHWQQPPSCSISYHVTHCMTAHVTWPQTIKLRIFSMNVKSSVLPKNELKMSVLIVLRQKISQKPRLLSCISPALDYHLVSLQRRLWRRKQRAGHLLYCHIYCFLDSHFPQTFRGIFSSCLFFSIFMTFWFWVFLSVFFTIIISFLTGIVCTGFGGNFNKSIYHSNPNAYLHIAIRER